MDEEVEACSRIYTAKLNELEAKSGIRASHRSVVITNVMLSVGAQKFPNKLFVEKARYIRLLSFKSSGSLD